MLPHVATEARALQSAPAVFEGGNIKEGEAEESGDLEAGFKSAAHIVEATYETQVQTHVCLETKGCVCEWEGDKLTAWISTQAARQQGGLRGGAADPAGERAHDLRDMGGGFGSKFGLDAQGVICAKLAKMAAAPVKLMLDRKEHLAGGNRPSSTRRSRPASRPTAPASRSTRKRRARVARVSAPASRCRTSTRSRTAGGAHKDVYTNAGPARAMRAPGHPQGCYATELLMDELADKVRMDPSPSG